jgi:hypothetical protein
VKRPSYCCQKCGEQIGWLGRLLWFIHRCNRTECGIHKLDIASDGVNKPLEAKFCNGDPILRFPIIGRITVSDELKPDEIAAMVLQMVKEQWLADPQAKKIRELHDHIKRLEEAGDDIFLLAQKHAPEYWLYTQTAFNNWRKAKEEA